MGECECERDLDRESQSDGETDEYSGGVHTAVGGAGRCCRWAGRKRGG